MDFGIFLGAVVIFCTATLPTTTAVETNCKVRRMRTSGLLICQFSVDINREKNNFLVHRYDLNGKNIRPELVLDCQWIVDQDLHCDVKSGYEFDKDVWNVLIVDLPSLSTRHDGKYICQVIGNGESKDNPCFYTHEGQSAETALNTTPAVTNQDKEANCVDHSASTIALQTTVLVIVFAIAIGHAVYLWHIRQSQGASKNGQQVQLTAKVQNSVSGPAKDDDSVTSSSDIQDDPTEQLLAKLAELKQSCARMEEEFRESKEVSTDTKATLLWSLETVNVKLEGFIHEYNEFKRSHSKSVKELKTTLNMVCEISTDTKDKLLFSLETLATKFDEIMSPETAENSSGDEDEPLYKPHDIDPLLR